MRENQLERVPVRLKACRAALVEVEYHVPADGQVNQTQIP